MIVPKDDTLRFYYDLLTNVDAKSDKGFITQIVCLD
jgi:hypothetical protein